MSTTLGCQPNPALDPTAAGPVHLGAVPWSLRASAAVQREH